MARALQSVLADLRDAGSDHVTTIGDILDAFQRRSLGVLLTLFAAIACLPVISALPGIPLLTASAILLAIFQSAFAQGGLWMPKRIRAIAIASDKFRRGIDKAMPWAKRLDRYIKPRFSVFVDGRVQGALIGICSALLAVSFLPMAIIPFATLAPAFAVLCFGLALLGKDGLFALIGYAMTLLTIILFVGAFDTIRGFL